MATIAVYADWDGLPTPLRLGVPRAQRGAGQPEDRTAWRRRLGSRGRAAMIAITPRNVRGDPCDHGLQPGK